MTNNHVSAEPFKFTIRDNFNSLIHALSTFVCWIIFPAKKGKCMIEKSK